MEIIFVLTLFNDFTNQDWHAKVLKLKDKICIILWLIILNLWQISWICKTFGNSISRWNNIITQKMPHDNWILCFSDFFDRIWNNSLEQVNAAQPMMSIVRLFIRMMGEMNKETVTNLFFISFWHRKAQKHMVIWLLIHQNFKF